MATTEGRVERFDDPYGDVLGAIEGLNEIKMMQKKAEANYHRRTGKDFKL